MISNEAIAIEKLFQIQAKSGKMVPFILNDAQRKLDALDPIYGRGRVIIAKARQMGFSSAILAKFTIRCLGRQGTLATILSHESNATERLLDKANFYLRHMNGPAPVFGRHSRSELFFEKTESTYYIGTAGAKAFGRGDTITDLHCSEYAFWDDPARHMAGLFQAVPYDGRIYIESTGNGRNNDFYYIWQHAEQMGYIRLFFPWWQHSEYQTRLPAHLKAWRPDLPRYASYLLDMQKKHGISSEAMFWYENKLKEMREDIKLMRQEYPSEAEECFQATGGAIFPDVEIRYTPDWRMVKYENYHTNQLFGHPKPGFHYVLGADPAGGTGRDDSALVIFCCETWEQVFEFFYNTVNPIEFGRILVSIGNLYNEAFIITEGNNHGAAVIPYLKEHYPKNKIYKSKLATAKTPPRYGWWNSQIAKHQLVGLMQEDINEICWYGSQTVSELKMFEEDEDEKMGGPSDNLVIASGLGMLGLRRFAHLRNSHIERPAPPPAPTNFMVFTLDDILKELDARRSGANQLFGRQVGRGYPYDA